ncbi:MAG: beta-glucanase (GH16 family) [Polaribacter sp.]
MGFLFFHLIKLLIMKFTYFSLLFVLLICSCSNDDENSGTNEPPVLEAGYEGYTLEWADEFDGESISNLNWTYELGDGTDYGLNPGWGNSELQLYTNAAANSFIEKETDGTSALVIQANEEADGSYSSAKLTTQNLQSFRFGRMEASIKLPEGQGIWPAFWLLGDNITEVQWPGCGEIDIMELIGSEPGTIHSTVHYTDSENSLESNMGTKALATGKFSEAYHLFTVDWTPETMTFSLDGNDLHTVTTEEDMKEFKRSFYMILNIAVGGEWPGNPDATTVFPQKMYVDYIRAYSKNDFTAPAAPVLDIDEETIGIIIPPSIAQYAFNSTLTQFPGIGLISYGAGGEPAISSSGMAVEGDSSLLFAYPGDNWGGGWFELETPIDMSSFSGGNLVFSLHKPVALADAEVKLEAVANSAAIFLTNYTPEAAADGYVTYTIPMSDFTDLDFSAIKIPFALWNPVNAAGEFVAMDVLVDDVYWE